MTQFDTHSFENPSPVLGSQDAEATMQQVFTDTNTTEPDQAACLVQIYPPDVVDGMMLMDGHRMVLGRDEDSDIVLDDSSVCRQHATISAGADGYYVEDLKSTNGTRVNGELVSRAMLNSGDCVQLGSFIFKFISGGCVESQYHETIYTSMTRDALTGTMNKRYLLESMQREIARAVRTEQPLCVVMIDIDHFKSVNDTHGHLVGDEVLREFGARLAAVCREEDLFARYGGEEFSMLLPSSSKQEAVAHAERCRKLVAETPFATAAGPLEIQASFGIGCLENKMLGCLDLIKIADDRLYDAKHQGRNRVVV